MHEHVEDSRMEELAAPLRESIKQDEARLVEIENERQEIMRRVRPIKAAINALSREHAKPGPKQTRSPQGRDRSGRPASEQSIERVSRFIAQHTDELGREFDARKLNQLMRGDGEGINISDQRRTMRAMHERGMLRLVSANGPGGRKTYAWISPDRVGASDE